LLLIAKEARQEAACIVLPKVAMTSVTVSSLGQGKRQNRITTFLENVFSLDIFKAWNMCAMFGRFFLMSSYAL
jgi:hypothetical protein